MLDFAGVGQVLARYVEFGSSSSEFISTDFSAAWNDAHHRIVPANWIHKMIELCQAYMFCTSRFAPAV